MPIVADASVAIRGDMSGFHQDLKAAETATVGFVGRLRNAFSPRNLALGAGVFGIGLGAQSLIRMAGDAAEAAAELEQTIKTIDNVFGESAGIIREWGETAAEAAGMSQRTFMSSAAVMGQTLLNMGFEQEEAAERSVQLLQRAADLAIAFGKRPQDALLAITAAMRGERDTIEKFGVAIKQVDVNARIAALGLDTSTAAAKKNAEAIAVVDLVLDQSEEQAGRFASSQEDIAVRMAQVNARWDDFMAKDVGGFVVGIQEFALDAADAVSGAGEDVAMFIDNLKDPDKQAAVQMLADRMGVSFGEMRHIITEEGNAAGLTWERQLAHMVAITEGAGQELGNAGERAGKDYSFGIEQSETAVREALEIGISDPVFDALLETELAAGKSGYLAVIEYAKGLLTPQTDVQVAIDTALAVVEEEMSKTEEYAYLSGQKVVLEEARGIALQEGKDAAVLAIDGALGLIQERMDVLEENAYVSGQNLIAAYVGGMYRGMPAISDAAYAMANPFSTTARIESEPKDHNSPLYGITKWGGNLVDTYAEGIFARLGTARAAGAALAGALVPGMGMVGGGMQLGGGMGTTINYNLIVDGQPIVVGSRDEVIDAWSQMETRK